MIAAVAKANPKTVVVLETGGPVAMPWTMWRVLAAWYPGARRRGDRRGAVRRRQSVGPPARDLSGFDRATSAPCPSGAETVEPSFAGHGKPGQTLDIDYNIEGADVGYRWFARQQAKPLYPFGFGLSYTASNARALP